MKSIPQTNPADLAGLIHASDRKPQRTKLILLGVTVVAVAIFIGESRQRAADAGQPRYLTEPIRRGDLNLTVTATGTLQPTNKVTVGSEISGLVSEVYVQSNDRVTKNQPLAKIDPTKLTQQRESAQAALNSAEAKVAQAQASVKQYDAALARQRELRRISAGRLPSQADLDSATATADRARADLLSSQAAVGEARASLQVAENDLAKTVIRSPINGLVLTRSIEPGQTVAATFTAPELFVIAEELERMKLNVSIAEADVGRLHDGQSAAFTVDAWADRAYTAQVVKVAYGSGVVDNVVTYQAELAVDNSDLTLRPGMTATVDIKVEERKGVLLVPTPALRFTPPAAAAGPEQKKSLVQSLVPMPPRTAAPLPTAAEKLPPGTGRIWISRDGTIKAVQVRPGISDGRMTEIAGDEIAAGQNVVLSSNSRSK